MGILARSMGPGPGRPGVAWLLAVALAAPARGSAAQEPPPPPMPAASGSMPPPPPIPPALPRVADLPPASSLIEGLGESVGLLEVKVGQGRFVVLKEPLAAPGQPSPFIAVGDPSVADFFQVGPSQLRLIGKKLGATDLTVTTGSGRTYAFDLQVVADLDILRMQLRQMFPEASLRLAQVRTKVVVEGQARDSGQVFRIIQAVETYIRSVQAIQVAGQVSNAAIAADPNAPPPAPPVPGAPGVPGTVALRPDGTPIPGSNRGSPGLGLGQGDPLGLGATEPTPSLTPTLAGTPVSGIGIGGGGSGPVPVSGGAVTVNAIVTGQLQVINLIRVPTSQQVMLKVQIAELDRTALRQVGADFLASIPQFKSLFGSQIAGNGYTGAIGNTTFPGVSPTLSGGTANGLGLGSQATFFGTFSGGQFNTVLNALRRNNIAKVLAEPNLIALNGYQASFLSGGEFPVPTFSGIGAGGPSGGGGSSTQFKKFGVQLSFLPLIQDNDTIRLTVDPEVSSIDFSVGTTLVPGGSIVPGLDTRNAHTTVELKQGETLAIAGLLSLNLAGNTQRLPGLGDLPYIGAFFSNTSSNRMEKELVVTVTPYIVEPMAPGQVPALPGEEYREPNDLEFFFMNRMEGRTGIDKRSTTTYDDPLHLVRPAIVEKRFLIGPAGYSQ